VTRYSPLASPSATRAHLKQWGLHTKKTLGQHFLIDDGVVGRILKLAELRAGDHIIEIGPGIGTLTMALLAQGAEVFAVEKDHNLLKSLANTFENETAFTLKVVDALDIDAVTDAMPFGTSQTLKLVANLPYAVAATVVLSYFENLPTLASATVMVQREVAQRMMAEPGTKDYGAYTVKLRMLAVPIDKFAVAATNFLPPPRVDSTVIRLDRAEPRISAELYEATSFVVEAAFAQRRKTIRNSMRAHFALKDKDPALVDTLLEHAGIDPQLRGETLQPRQFSAMGTHYHSLPHK